MNVNLSVKNYYSNAIFIWRIVNLVHDGNVTLKNIHDYKHS